MDGNKSGLDLSCYILSKINCSILFQGAFTMWLTKLDHCASNETVLTNFWFWIQDNTDKLFRFSAEELDSQPQKRGLQKNSSINAELLHHMLRYQSHTVSSARDSVRFTFNFISIKTVQFNKRDLARQALSGWCKYHFATSCNVLSLKHLYLLTSAAVQLTIIFFSLTAHCMLKIDCISHHNRSCRCEEIRHVRLETNQSTNQQLPHFSTNRELKHKTFCSDTFTAAIKLIHRTCKLS